MLGCRLPVYLPEGAADGGPGRETVELMKPTVSGEPHRRGEERQLLLFSDPHWDPLQWEVSHREGILLNNLWSDLIICFISSAKRNHYLGAD